MTGNELLLKLKDIPKDCVFEDNLDISEDYSININYNFLAESSTTLKDFITDLEAIPDLDLVVELDIDDGFTYREVIDVEITDNIIEFVTE